MCCREGIIIWGGVEYWNGIDWGSSPGRNAEGERVGQRDSSVAFCYTKRR
jgi:hypothetical protein